MLYDEAGRSEAAIAPARIVTVPYYQWGNRKPGGEKAAWLRKGRA
jgi:DUF1680 family protein